MPIDAQTLNTIREHIEHDPIPAFEGLLGQNRELAEFTEARGHLKDTLSQSNPSDADISRSLISYSEAASNVSAEITGASGHLRPK